MQTSDFQYAVMGFLKLVWQFIRCSPVTFNQYTVQKTKFFSHVNYIGIFGAVMINEGLTW